MYDIVFVGAGGCARELYDTAKAAFPSEEYRFKGCLSDDLTVLDDFPDIRAELPLLGRIVDYEVQPQDRFIIAIGDVAGRRKVIEAMKARGAVFLQLVPPEVLVFPTAKLGEGVVLYRGVCVSDHAVLEDFAMLNYGAIVGHDARVGAYSVLCPYAAVLGYAKVEEDCLLGTHATVQVHTLIGRGSTVGANTFAARKAPAGALVLGVPGKNY